MHTLAESQKDRNDENADYCLFCYKILPCQQAYNKYHVNQHMPRQTSDNIKTHFSYKNSCLSI